MSPTKSSIEECEKYRLSKTTYPDRCHVHKGYTTKTSSQVRIKKRKKLYESRTTLSRNSMERERGKTYVQGHRILQKYYFDLFYNN